MSRRLRVPLGLLLAVLLGFGLLGYGASQVLGTSLPVTPELGVQQRLECPLCQGVRLDVCDRPVCADMRADIRRRLDAGESPDSIVADYAQAYGPAVLATGSAAGPTGWVPWLFVLLGLLLLLALAAGRRRLPPVPPPAPDSALPGLVDRELAAWRRGG